MSQIWDIYCKHCLWSIFGPCWCTKSCKTTFYAHLSRIWKLTRFTCFIWKVFATKILLSGKFSLFVTLVTTNLSYALWENNSGSNLLWESSASCEGLGRTMKDPGFHKIGQKTNTTLYPPMEDLLQLYFTMLHCFLVRPVAKIWFWRWSLLAFSKRFTARRGPGK